MKKKLLSLLLALCMLLTLAPAALADGETDGAEDALIAPNPDADVRETNFFTDQPHADVNWEDMEYTPVSKEDFFDAIEEVEALLDDPANSGAVLEKFRVVADMFMTIRANITILNIRHSLDATDEDNFQLYKDEYALYIDIFDPFIYLVRAILLSACKDYFIQEEHLTQDDIDSYVNYGGMTDEQKELTTKISVLEETYDQVASIVVDSVEYNGVEWTEEEAYEAAVNGEISVDDFYAIEDLLLDAQYAPLGELYMQVLDLNTQLAAAYDYDNYADFSYVEEYGRDYTSEEIEAFCQAVREYIVPFYNDLGALQQDSINQVFFKTPFDYNSLMYTDYTSDEMLMTIRPYIGQMSSELLEAYDYMLTYGLYDIAPSDVKGDGGFTTNIGAYGSPFFYNSPYKNYFDFSTIIHEFGHYDNYYWHPSGWNDGSSDIDVAEVHSQAMEMLFIQFYEDILGGAAEFMAESTVLSILGGALINGALIGELEVYAATTEDVTIADIADKYAELLVAYGFADEETAYYNRYGFLDIHHVITSPMYYISYATSASGAFSFWLEAQSDGYETATDHYLEFVSQSVYTPFLEQFENAGMENPLTPEYVKAVVDELSELFNLDERLEAYLNPTPVFKDVPLDDPYNSLVERAHAIGAVNGDGTGNYNPGSLTNRAQVVQALYNVFSQYAPAEGTESPFTDVEGQWYADAANWAYEFGITSGEVKNGKLVFNGNGLVTREMIATLVYNTAKLFFEDAEPSQTYDYADADSISPWAVDAIMWLTEAGILSPVDEAGNILPHGVMTRLNLASYVYNIFLTIFA